MEWCARSAAVVVLAAALVGAAGTPASAQPAGPVVGAASGGDPYFPAAGNGGYDVKVYDLDLTYDPPTRALTARATIAATATQALSRFNLDLRGLTVDKVAVNGTPATFVAQDGELVVTPRQPLQARLPFVTVVDYHIAVLDAIQPRVEAAIRRA